MARIQGPLLSMGASGSVGDVLTFSTWKGIAVCKEWFTPHNPRVPKQVNVRTAMTLLVALWGTLSEGQKAVWDNYAAGTGMSGFNKFVSRGMDQFVIQITTLVLPVSVSVVGVAPIDVWTWT